VGSISLGLEGFALVPLLKNPMGRELVFHTPMFHLEKKLLEILLIVGLWYTVLTPEINENLRMTLAILLSVGVFRSHLQYTPPVPERGLNEE
jgi:hypothetical protein